jgi:hypothetical protein
MCGLQRLFGGRDVDSCVEDGLGDLRSVASFRVTRVWKGPEANSLSVGTFPGGTSSCGFTWAVGDQWVIYAESDDESYVTHTCTRSSVGAAAAEEARELDAAQ